MSHKELCDVAYEALPFVGISILGSLIRSINIKPFSWKDTLIRILTAGFLGSLTIMFLSTTTYTTPMQGFICGIVGILGADLFEAVRIRMFKEVTGKEPPEDDDNDRKD